MNRESLFELKQETIESEVLGSVVIQAANAETLLKVMPLIESGKNEEAATLLASTCILIEGKPLGNDIKKVNGKAFMELVTLSKRIADLSGFGGNSEEKKD
jgi:hypothetical protein